MLVNAALSAVLNVIILAGVPFFFYYCFHKWRHKRGIREVAQRAGLRSCDSRYLGYSIAFAAVSVAILLIWPPPLETMLQEGSATRQFAGLGFNAPSVVMALLYGVIKTGFSEELLFRGLIAGSLGRRLPLWQANTVQGLIFLVPHLFILMVMPQTWGVLPLVFVGSLVLGWLRIKSDSILGPWLIHAAANVASTLSVAIRSAADQPGSAV